MVDSELKQRAQKWWGLRRIIVVLGILSVLGQLGSLHWILDWLALLHHYYFAGGVVTLVILMIMRRWGWAGGAAVVVALNGWLLLPYAPTAGVVEGGSTDSIRVVVYNMYYANEDLAGMVEAIESYEADVVFIMEYSYNTQAAIETEFDGYKYRLIEPSRMTMGLALFSHLPIAYAEVHRQQATRIPVFEVGFESVDGRPFTFVGGHPWPPLPQWGSLHRAQMGSITAVAAEAPHPLIVGGDFNASAWSYAVRDLAQAAEVQDAHEGFLFRPTWTLNPLVHLPMDHVFVSEEWQVVDYVHGEPGGSDHDLLVVDLVLGE